jgi:hypothetical protein
VVKRKGEYFVLMTTSEWMRGYPPRGGFGGGGVEAYVTWLHVVDGKAGDTVSERYMSFHDNREGSIVGWRGSVFTVRTEDWLEDKDPKEKVAWQTITITFDTRHPEEGIKVEKSEPHEKTRKP